MRINRTRSFFKYLMISLGILFTLIFPVQAERSLEWRDDGLWVLDDTGEHFFEAAGHFPADTWLPRVASLSPDGEWVAFVRHTGGGFEDEGQSCYVARWNGEDERLILESFWLIPAIYWLQAEDCMYVVCQKQSGGTMYHSHFAVVDFDTGQIITQVEGNIYGLSYGGTSYWPYHWWGPTGLRYEILGMDEEPVDWGIFYLDELITFDECRILTLIDGILPWEHPSTDGQLFSAWLGESGDQPIITIELSSGEISGIGFYSGWQWHAPPDPDGSPWEGRDLFREYDRPAEIVIYFDDGSSVKYTLEDKRGMQYIFFEDIVNTSTVTIKVMSVYSGLVDHRCAISEIFPY